MACFPDAAHDAMVSMWGAALQSIATTVYVAHVTDGMNNQYPSDYYLPFIHVNEDESAHIGDTFWFKINTMMNEIFKHFSRTLIVILDITFIQ